MFEHSESRAVEVLCAEHRHIERVLVALGGFVERAASRQGAPQPEPVAAVVRFLEDFADRRHHEKEEGGLFEEMRALGFAADSGPIACMLRQHVLARELVSVMRRWTCAGAALREREVGEFYRAARDYQALLIAHIGVEEAVLYPAAVTRLPRSSLLRISEVFRSMDPPSWHEELVSAADEVVAGCRR